MESSEIGAVAPAAKKRSWRVVLVEEVRSHLLAYIAAAVFCVLGPIFARMIFPEASTGLVIFGGIAFGVHFAFCALADKFFE